jgi:hypothetical protein
MTVWRFDQGRLDYFQFDEIKKIARALVALDGIQKPSTPNKDILRETLKNYSDLPFAPADYYVWRNYKRVFGCQLLASEINNRIYVTDLCRVLTDNNLDLDADDYFAHVAKNFYYNSPIFEGYEVNGRRVFPIVAVIKYLLAQVIYFSNYKISIDGITQYLIGNNVDGTESLEFYGALARTAHELTGEQPRQLRELLRFISQFSFLKWNSPYLYIEITSMEEIYELEKNLSPTINIRNGDTGAEILQMGSGFVTDILGSVTLTPIETLEEEFTEGKKIRVTHLRSERSGKLKQIYFSNIPNPQVCDMCNIDTNIKYPWTQHTIELHHLLPLSSPIRVEIGKTSLKDLVGLCPSCHRATHKYYGGWLKTNGVKDFRSYTEARAIYAEAKSKVA